MCGKSKNSGQVLLSIGQVCVSTVVNLADSFALGGEGPTRDCESKSPHSDKSVPYGIEPAGFVFGTR